MRSASAFFRRFHGPGKESPYLENRYEYEEDPHLDYMSCLRYIDWKRGNPYVFCNEDFEDLVNSPYLFARKFDLNVDAQIVFRIYNHLKGQTYESV